MKSSVAVYLIKCYCDNNNDFFYINLTTWDWYFFSISSLYSDKPIVNKYCCKVTAINFYTGLFQKNIVVGGGGILRISIFLKLTFLNFQSNLLWTPLKFSLFVALTPLKIPCFSSIFCVPMYPSSFSSRRKL